VYRLFFCMYYAYERSKRWRICLGAV